MRKTVLSLAIINDLKGSNFRFCKNLLSSVLEKIYKFCGIFLISCFKLISLLYYLTREKASVAL